MARSKKNLSKKKVPQQISVSSTPPLTALELRLIRDLLCAINNSDFAARFPWLLKKTWNVLGSRNPEVTEGCRSIGKKAMEMSLCILSLDVHGGIEKGLPIGLSDSLERCFYSEQVLFAILKKADEKQATRIASIGVPTAKVGQVRDGVMLFAGGMWSEGQDLTAVMSWVNGLFRSLVAVAIKSYKSVTKRPPLLAKNLRDAEPAALLTIYRIYGIQMASRPPKVSADVQARFFDLAVAFCSTPLRMGVRGSLERNDDREHSLQGSSATTTLAFKLQQLNMVQAQDGQTGAGCSTLRTPISFKRKREPSWDPPTAHSPLSPSPKFASFLTPTPSDWSSCHASPAESSAYLSPAISPLPASNPSPVFSPLPDNDFTPTTSSPFFFTPSTESPLLSPNLYLSGHQGCAEVTPKTQSFSPVLSATPSTPPFTG